LQRASSGQTCEGESPEVFPFLGSTQLEEPINRFRVTAAFHATAHNGPVEGVMATGVPVYNVSAPSFAGEDRQKLPHHRKLRCSRTTKTESK
jgi:hypothetical protein